MDWGQSLRLVGAEELFSVAGLILLLIAAWVGDNALACEQLAVAVRYTSSLSYGQLKLMPWWDPLRGDPCFERIVASLAPK